jgi:hypothetical protein
MTKTKTHQILLPLVGFAAVATGVSLLLDLSLFMASGLFWGLPALYLSLVNRRAVGSALLFSLAAAVTFGLMVDYLGFINHVWDTPESIFSYWIFSLVPIENPMWSFLYIYNVIMVYECLANKKPGRPSKRFFWFIGGLALLAVVVHLAADRIDALRNIPYLYFSAGMLFFVAPAAAFLAKYPKYLHNFVATACYLVPIAFANEVVGLTLGHWYFPAEAELLGHIGVLGVAIPFEELFFFILFGPIAILTYYVYTFKFGSRVMRATGNSSHDET